MLFARRMSSRRVSMTCRPHPRHSRPMSAPRRITFQSVAPQGCAFPHADGVIDLQVWKHARLYPPRIVYDKLP